MENQLVYIIRGLPAPLDHAVADELIDYLKAYAASPEHANPLGLMEMLESAGRFMQQLPQYDMSDFNPKEFHASIDLLATGNPAIWAQLLHALDDRHSGAFSKLKALSPFCGKYLMFLDSETYPSQIQADLDDELAAELMKRADAHEFPGNCYVVVLSPEMLDQMSFVPAIDDIPATA